jgi:4-hydroxy-tetrahydrodipicolinate synthase
MNKLDESARDVFVIAVTPFNDRGDIDEQSTDRLVEFYLERGIAGMTILGIMGEAPKLTAADLAEIERLIERQTRRLRELG